MTRVEISRWAREFLMTVVWPWFRTLVIGVGLAAGIVWLGQRGFDRWERLQARKGVSR